MLILNKCKCFVYFFNIIFEKFNKIDIIIFVFDRDRLIIIYL